MELNPQIYTAQYILYYGGLNKDFTDSEATFGLHLAAFISQPEGFGVLR